MVVLLAEAAEAVVSPDDNMFYKKNKLCYDKSISEIK